MAAGVVEPVGGAAWTAGWPALGRLTLDRHGLMLVAMLLVPLDANRGTVGFLVANSLSSRCLVLVVLLLGLGAATLPAALVVAADAIDADPSARRAVHAPGW